MESSSKNYTVIRASGRSVSVFAPDAETALRRALRTLNPLNELVGEYQPGRESVRVYSGEPVWTQPDLVVYLGPQYY